MKIKAERSGYSSIGFAITSGDGDDYPGCRLQGFGWYVSIYLPAWLLTPAKSWRDLSSMVGRQGYDFLKPNADGGYGYWEKFERRYGLTYTENALHVAYGKQTNEWSGCKSKCIFLPWLEWRHVRTSYYSLDGSLFHHVTHMGYPELREVEAKQEAAYYEFRDFDGEVIKAKCRVEEREWRHGTGYFKWLSLFRRAKVRRSLDLNFSSEVGSRKGSWKGGTLGHGIEMKKGESVQAAFIRYCLEQNLAYVSECEAWSR